MNWNEKKSHDIYNKNTQEVARQLSSQGAEFPLNGTEISIQPLFIWVIQEEVICTLPCILQQISLPIYHLVSLLKPVGKMVRKKLFLVTQMEINTCHFQQCSIKLIPNQTFTSWNKSLL